MNTGAQLKYVYTITSRKLINFWEFNAEDVCDINATTLSSDKKGKGHVKHKLKEGLGITPKGGKPIYSYRIETFLPLHIEAGKPIYMDSHKKEVSDLDESLFLGSIQLLISACGKSEEEGPYIRGLVKVLSLFYETQDKRLCVNLRETYIHECKTHKRKKVDGEASRLAKESAVARSNLKGSRIGVEFLTLLVNMVVIGTLVGVVLAAYRDFGQEALYWTELSSKLGVLFKN